MNLIDVIRGLRSATPGTISETLHREFQKNMAKDIDITKLKLALEEIEFKNNIGVKDVVVSVLTELLGDTSYRDFNEIDEHIKNGHYIAAIKEYRMKTGMGLADSKAYIDMRKKELCI